MVFLYRFVVTNVMLQLKIEKKAGDTALISMTQNVQSRLDVRQRKRAWFIFASLPSLDFPAAHVHLQMTYPRRCSVR